MSTSTLTDRQQEVLERLEKSMSAQEIANDLGVTRNAVYQQIQAIRKKGHLEAGYTPSGQPPRALDAPVSLVAGESISERLIARQAAAAEALERLAAQLRADIGA